MQNERPKKIDCPVPDCTYQRLDRKRVLQHMRGNPHNINLNNDKTGPQGGNESLRRQKHTKRYARWLRAQGLPIDVKFFTNVDDELKSVQGWEEVHLSEDDRPTGQSTRADEDEDGGAAPSNADDIPSIRSARQRRTRYTVQDVEDDEEDEVSPIRGGVMGNATDQNKDVRTSHEFTEDEECSWWPEGWTAEDEEGAENLILLSRAFVIFGR